MRTAKSGLTGLLLVSLTVAGCGGDPAPEAAPPPDPAAVAAPRPGADYTAAVSLGSTAAAARLQFQIEERPVIGRPVTVRFRVIPSGTVQKIQVVFEAEAGLAFVDELRATVIIDGAATAAAAPHELQVVPDRNGVLLLKANVMTEVEGDPRSTDFAVPLLVKDAPAAAPPAGTGG